MKNPSVTKLRCAWAPVLLCVAAAQAQAFSINTTESHYEPSGVRYYFTVTNWTTSESNKNPCVTDDPIFTICVVRLMASESSTWARPQGDFFYRWEIPIRRGNSTTGQLLSDLQNKGLRIPLSGSILVPYPNASNRLCISFGYATIGPNIGGGVGLFGPCTPVVTPALQCKITGNTNINHKILSDIEVDGAKASTQLSVICRGPASVNVSASRTNSYGVRLRDDDSLYSKITVNGKDATAGINVPVSDGLASPLSITSTLVTRGTVSPGVFSGSTVITVTPP